MRVELVGASPTPPRLAAQLRAAGITGGAVTLTGSGWAWAFPLNGTSGHLGHLVVGARREPSGEEQFLLRALAQQVGGALANRRLHAQEQDTAATLAVLNERLRGSVGALRRSMDIHARLTAVAVSGEGREGIARAVHELTGLQVAVEDRHGNLQAWAGSPPPDPYPKDTPACRERLLARAKQEGRPIRDGARLLAIAHPQGDTLGVIVLVDPARRAGDQELMALEHGATCWRWSWPGCAAWPRASCGCAATSLDELLAGTDDTDSAVARATALGYDLQRPHRVVVVEGHGPAGEQHPLDTLLQAVRRAARDEPAGTLLATRGTEVVLLADTEPEWESLRPGRAARAGRRADPAGGGGTLRRRRRVPALLPPGQARAAAARAGRVGRPRHPVRRPRRLPAARRDLRPRRGGAVRAALARQAARVRRAARLGAACARCRTTWSTAATTSSPRSRSSCTATR